MKKRLSALLLAIVLILGLMPVGTFAAEAATSIKSSKEFAEMTANGNYKLTADITVMATYGDYNKQFIGTFDGDGHTVTLNISGTTSYKGLFGYIGIGGIVKNVRVTGTVSSNSNMTGGIAGYSKGIIENCINSASITGAQYTGGIVGQDYGDSNNKTSIRGCSNTGSISGTKYVGGIVGKNAFGSIANCYNTGAVSASVASTARVGGIVGDASSGTGCEIKSCYSTGLIVFSGTGSPTQYGSLVGYLDTNYVVSGGYYENTAYSVAVGNNVPKSGVFPITSKTTLLTALQAADSNAWTDDIKNINNGYPILAWQSGSVTPPDTTPSLSISGDNTIYAQPSVGTTSATLTVVKKNMDGVTVGNVTWSLEKKGGGSSANIATLEPVSNNTDQIVVKAAKGGIATITASVAIEGQAEPVTTSADITVIPQITTAEIKNVIQPGAVAVGQNVEAKVNTVGGVEYDYASFPALTYQWQYRPSGGTATDISGATSKTFTIPEQYKEWDYIQVDVKCGGKVVVSGSDNSQNIRSADYGKLYPVAAAFTLPSEIKDGKALILPTTYTVGGTTANIEWGSTNDDVIKSDGTVTLPASDEVSVTLTAKFKLGSAYSNRIFNITVLSQAKIDEKATENTSHLKAAKDSLGTWFRLTPVCGKDTNIEDMVKKALGKTYEDITVSVKNATEVYGNCGIAPNGDITYFYADPNGSRGAWFGSYKATFTLTKGDASVELTNVPVTIYWDVTKVKDTMTSEILGKVSMDTILASGDTAGAVTKNLSLPKVVDNKKWTLISWTSSDPGAISISSANQSTADTLFNPYVGKVIRGATDKIVTLTAAFTFQRTNDVIGSEPPIVMYKTFKVIVKALSDADAKAASDKLLAELDAGFTKTGGLKDYVTGDALTENGGVYTAINDIQLPTTHDYGVDGKYYPVTITSDNPKTVVAPDVANAARVIVYRPPVGESEVENVKLTVTMTDTANGISASKEFIVTVLPLTQGEIKDELALMEQVKVHYFDGIKNANSAADNITGNLHAFQEAYLDKDSLVWVYDSKDLKNHGIIPDAMDGWYDLQVWRLFKSSNPAVVSHENLLVTSAENAKEVVLESALSSEVYGKYGERYLEDPSKYAGYASLAGLYKQEVSANLIVRGIKDPTSSTPVAETLSASFTLQSADSTWLSKTTVSGLPEGATAFDLFTKVLSDNGYSYKARGSYITAITSPDGKTLSELDKGSNSGWMYKVNGAIPSSYMAAYPLKNGDKVVVFFTKDYTEETGYADWGQPEKGSQPAESITTAVTARDGKAEAAVSSEAVASAIAKNNGKVVIAPQVNGSASSVSMSLTAASVKKIADNASGTLSFETNSGSVSIPNETLNSISKQTGSTEVKMTVAAKSAADVKLPAADTKNAVIVEISISSGEKKITSFGGGALGVAIPVTGDFKEGESYKVIVISSDGTTEILAGKVIKKDGKSFAEVSVTHLSTFIVTASNVEAYTDVKKDAWYYDSVEYASMNGLMTGVGEKTFAPKAQISRAMLVTVLYRMAGSPAVTEKSGFKDVTDSTLWYYNAVVWASKNGIVNGYGDGSFGINDNITREQLAAIFYRYAKYKGCDVSAGDNTNILSYSDSLKISEWAYPGLQWALGAGILNGTSADTISPYGSATRGEAAAVITRFAKSIKP